jgi:hypothetical protein
MSADAPTAPLDPFLQMEVIMLRKEPDLKCWVSPADQPTNNNPLARYDFHGETQQIELESFRPINNCSSLFQDRSTTEH